MQGARLYRFASEAQWRCCLTTGLLGEADGGLTVWPAIGETAVRVGLQEKVSAVAVDRLGSPVWRIGSAIRRFDDFGEPGSPEPVDTILASSARLLISRHWVWAYAHDRVVRFDRPTLQRDGQLNIADIADVLRGGSGPWSVLDIATDGRTGVWLLVGSPGARHLLRFDCNGCKTAAVKLPCDWQDATQLVTTNNGATIVVLANGSMALVNALEGSVVRQLCLATVQHGWVPTRVASDGRQRLGVGGFIGNAEQQWSLILMDGGGELVQGPIRDLADAPVNDLAVTADSIWLATDKGLLRSDGSEASGGAALTAVVQTPLLHAPASASGRGWSRAELDVIGSAGASINATVASTNDPRLADAVAAIAANEILSAADRQRRIWSLLDPDDLARPVRLDIEEQSLTSLAVPLFEHQGAWLVLRLSFTVPPFAKAPIIRELRLHYPERSLMEQLPAIYSDPANDPQGLLRKLVGIIETTTQKIDADIGSVGRRLEATTAPPEWLDYLGSWLDLPWHSGLTDWSKRKIIQSAGRLLDWRGTKRGLEVLAECLAGDGGKAEVVDVIAENTTLLLGGAGRPGSQVRGLLAGYRPTTPALGTKAVLGRARLKCPDDPNSPLDILAPIVIVRLQATAATIASTSAYAQEVLAQYVPAGVSSRVAWIRIVKSADDDEGIVLETIDEGTIGLDAVLGETALAGQTGSHIGDGFELDVRLR